MRKLGRSSATFYGLLVGASVVAGHAVAQNAPPIEMRLSTATLNDAQHEWMKRFAVAIGKKHQWPDQGRRVSREPAR
jgi:hypothetical protein